MGKMFKFTGIAEEVTWQPTDIAGCKLWLREDAIYDGSKRESQITDKSGNLNHVIQTTDDQKPIYVENEIDGCPVHLADGVDDEMTNSGYSARNGIQGSTTVWIFKCLGATGVPIMYANFGGALQWTGGNMNVYVASGVYGYFPFTDLTAYHRLLVVFDGTLTGDANRLKVWLDGVQQTLAFNGTIPSSYATANGFVFGSLGGSNWANFKSPEYIDYAKAISPTEKTLLDNYVEERYPSI